MFLGNTRVWVCCATLLLTGVLQKNIHKSYQHTTSKSYHTVRNFESFNDDLWSTCVLPCSWHKSPALKWRFFYCTSPANQRHSVYGSKLVLATAKGETMRVGFGNYIIRPRDSSCRNLSGSRWGGAFWCPYRNVEKSWKMLTTYRGNELSDIGWFYFAFSLVEWKK